MPPVIHCSSTGTGQESGLGDIDALCGQSNGAHRMESTSPRHATDLTRKHGIDGQKILTS